MLYAIAARLPVHNNFEPIAYAKKEPGKRSYGFSQIGITSLIGPWFNKLAGTEMVGIPIRTTAR